jgi:hypothetical protein
VAKAEITVTRRAKSPKYVDGKRVKPIAGRALALRLIVSRIVDNAGYVPAKWLLLNNVKAVSTTTIALWYYWRWCMELFVKLLQQAGHQLESWQQESGLALAKRLLVANMAGVVVWPVAHSKLSQAPEVQELLIQLRGRQMKRNQLATWPALFSGLWVFYTTANRTSITL